MLKKDSPTQVNAMLIKQVRISILKLNIILEQVHKENCYVGKPRTAYSVSKIFELLKKGIKKLTENKE